LPFEVNVVLCANDARRRITILIGATHIWFSYFKKNASRLFAAQVSCCACRRKAEVIPGATPHRVDRARKAVAVALLVVSLIAIAALTLTPTESTAEISFWCLKCGERRAVDLLLNILMFGPLGLALGLYGFRFRPAALSSLACTCLIEALQFSLVPGRYASFRDILANFTGALIGYGLARHWRILVAPNPRAARMVATIAAILWLTTQALTAWAMGIWLPAEPWWAQLRPGHDEYPAVFTDELVGVSVGSVQIRESDQLASDDADEIREQLLAGAAFRVEVADVEPTRQLAQIAVISAGPVYDPVWWAQDQLDGVFSVTVRGTRLGLRTPTVRIANVFPAVRGDTITLTGSYRGGLYKLRAEGRSGVRQRELRASASWGWAFLLPFPSWAFGSTVSWITAFYLAAVSCLLGYWNARSSAEPSAWAPIARMAVTIFLGLVIVPITFNLPVAHWSEWVAAIVGAAAGWTIAYAISVASSPMQRSIRE